MHIALQTDDILGEIFSHLRVHDVGDERDTATPYHAALACNHFLPHALDALWFYMKELEPLFELLPSNSVSWDDPVSSMLNIIFWFANMICLIDFPD